MRIEHAHICLQCDEIFDRNKAIRDRATGCPRCGNTAAWPLEKWISPGTPRYEDLLALHIATHGSPTPAQRKEVTHADQ